MILILSKNYLKEKKFVCVENFFWILYYKAWKIAFLGRFTVTLLPEARARPDMTDILDAVAHAVDLSKDEKCTR